MRGAAMMMREATASVAVMLRMRRMAGRHCRIFREGNGPEKSNGACNQRRCELRSSRHVFLPISPDGFRLRRICRAVSEPNMNLRRAGRPAINSSAPALYRPAVTMRARPGTHARGSFGGGASYSENARRARIGAAAGQSESLSQLGRRWRPASDVGKRRALDAIAPRDGQQAARMPARRGGARSGGGRGCWFTR
jgi:hypothetical protein